MVKHSTPDLWDEEQWKKAQVPSFEKHCDNIERECLSTFAQLLPPLSFSASLSLAFFLSSSFFHSHPLALSLSPQELGMDPKVKGKGLKPEDLNGVGKGKMAGKGRKVSMRNTKRANSDDDDTDR